jgi:hypothetical protein
MPFRKIADRANRSVDWRNRAETIRNTTVANARRIAMRYPDVTYFVFCHKEINFPSHGEFFPNDAILFKGAIADDPVDDGVADIYVKDLFNVAYFDSKCPNSEGTAGHFEDVATYRVGDRGFFDIAVLFAANIRVRARTIPNSSSTRRSRRSCAAARSSSCRIRE